MCGPRSFPLNLVEKVTTYKVDANVLRQHLNDE